MLVDRILQVYMNRVFKQNATISELTEVIVFGPESLKNMLICQSLHLDGIEMASDNCKVYSSSA